MIDRDHTTARDFAKNFEIEYPDRIVTNVEVNWSKGVVIVTSIPTIGGSDD